MQVAGLRRERKHLPHSSDFFYIVNRWDCGCFSVVVRPKVTCMEGVFMSGDVASWDEITCIECLSGGGERRKIPCIVLLKKALQASQEATP